MLYEFLIDDEFEKITGKLLHRFILSLTLSF